MAGRPVKVEVGGRTIMLTHPDKILYPSTGTRKADVLDYYLAVADRLVAWSHDRPASRKRWVHGVGTAEAPGQAFFTKQLERGAPDWVARRDIPHADRVIAYPLVNDPATLAWLAQMDTLEVHVPQWSFGPDGVPRPPDRLVLDLDPGPGVGLRECVRVAREARLILADMGLDTTPVTSGSKGLHLYAALPGTASSDQVSGVARALARALAEELPGLVVDQMRRSLRTGRVFLDWSQNNGRKTTICPWSLRGRLTPTVAAPRAWDELDDPALAQLTMTEVLDRLRDAPAAAPPAGATDTRPGAGPAKAEPPGAGPAGGDTRPIARPPAADTRSAAGPAAAPPGVASVAMVPVATSAGPAPWDSPSSDPSTSPGPAPSTSPGPDLPQRTYAPMLATAGTLGLMTGEGWAYEMKWDGIRVLARTTGRSVRLTGRTGRDVTATYPELSELGTLARQDLVVDGEVVAIGRAGRPDFGLLQVRMNLTGAGDVNRLYEEVPVSLMVFDLLEASGRDLTAATYDERRELLGHLLPSGHHVLVPPAHPGPATAAMAVSAGLGLEGIVAKRRRSTYRPGVRSTDWLKIKHLRSQEVVVIGWRPGADGRDLAAVLTAVPDSAGRLVYTGRVGSGFGARARQEAIALLGPLAREDPPVEVPDSERAGPHWVEPRLVAEVRYGEVTATGRFRHPVWRGWRPDRAPEEIRWE
ncbi:non-homologous end-joining DNA ligase [Raineyella sp.]|nr:non-homologous end-joining DNA ligase [Raineyella sp.]MEA5155818.1 non-homologous end-joining DNA ligase [Raineyella sp.]